MSLPNLPNLPDPSDPPNLSTGATVPFSVTDREWCRKRRRWEEEEEEGRNVFVFGKKFLFSGIKIQKLLFLLRFFWGWE
jgi:hypothetical protein